MSEKLNIKDYPYHTHAAIIEVANTAIAKAYEAGQRHLPESVEMIIEAAREYEKRMAAIARDDQVDLGDMVDSWEMDVIVAIRRRDKEMSHERKN